MSALRYRCLIEQFGPENARELGSAAAYLIGLQFYAGMPGACSAFQRGGIEGFVEFFMQMAESAR